MNKVEYLSKKLIEAKRNKDEFAIKIIITRLLQNISKDDIVLIRETFGLEEEETPCIN